MFSTIFFRRTDLSIGPDYFSRLRKLAFFFLGIISGVGRYEVQGVDISRPGDSRPAEPSVVITNIGQLRLVSSEVFLGRCGFRFNAIVTLLDTNRDLLVVQDETGAVALNPARGIGNLGVHVGQQVSLEGSRCFPQVAGFSDYPFRPSGSEVRSSFTAPEDWGSYYLTRLRAVLHPPVTGEYTFWTSSDNSSELWLSSSEDPTLVKKIAFVPRYGWSATNEWSRYPSQRSENILLRAGHSYYIEAFQEQTTVGDHLEVAWRGPNLNQAIIAGRYLTPWSENLKQSSHEITNGVLREYWTNFSSGGLAQITGPKSFESILSVDELRVTALGGASWPRPEPITLNQPLRLEDNYRWVEVEGDVTFAGSDGTVGVLDLSDGESQIQVRVPGSDAASLRRFRNSTVRVKGVCEGVYDSKGALFSGLVWAANEANVSLLETAKPNSDFPGAGQSSSIVLTSSNAAMVGFYGTRGVVTFNDRVFGKDLMFVQEESAVILVSLKDRNFKKQFPVGSWVDLGGSIQPGKTISVLNPMVVTELGWHAMPAPMPPPEQSPVPGNRDGRWTEVEGVVHSVNSNGTVTLVGSGGPLAVWIGKSSRDLLNQYVDAKLRVRGVLSLNVQDLPTLLAPSATFVNVDRDPPVDPFAEPAHLAATLFTRDPNMVPVYRTKIVGNISFIGNKFFFMQDGSGGVRVQPTDFPELQVGQTVEVVGFPGVDGSIHTLTDALVRPAEGIQPLPVEELDGSEGISFKHSGTLVRIKAQLIAQRVVDGSQILELQEKQRVFQAVLPNQQANLPAFAPGSRLQLSGVCDFTAATLEKSGTPGAESPSTGALKIWLRNPADVVLLSRPPWWSWKHTTTLVGILFTVSVISLLRAQLLRRRLERQLAFSREILESQEIERHRIAANLHDSLGQNLLVIKNQARLAMQPTADEAILRQRLNEISGCASQAIVEVREITHALRPYQLDRLGLTRTIRATVNRAAENSSILFASHADEIDGLLDKESEIHVYRIVQEALNNILKHSAATEAAIVAKKLTTSLALSIRDNGRGFDPAATNNADSEDVGHGINGIKERVRILGGTLAVDSRSGQGTSLTIEIPVPASKHEK